MGSILRSNGSLNVKKIAIIGAGPSGLAAARFLLAERAFDTIDVYEQQSEVGGVWYYHPNVTGRITVPQTTPHGPPELPIWPKDGKAPLFSNPMYDHLNTNIPHGLMGFSDLEFPPESLLFPTRQDVQSYLVKYSQEIRHLIKFSTQVKNIVQSPRASEPQWELTAKSTITDEEERKDYDAIVVANGHYSVPFIPSVLGVEAFNAAYPSVITHSKVYRAPEPFTNKKVIVVGSAASGLDIGTQISQVSKKPMLNSVRTSSPLKFGQENKEEVPPIAEYIVEDRAVRFEDGRVEKDIDAIIYCTGYLYSYPFFEELDPTLVTTGRRVRGLYKQLFNITHPTLAFTALSQKIIPFPLSEGQGTAIAKVWSGKLDLPTKVEMESWEEERIAELGDGTAFHVLGYPKDAEYVNELHDWVQSAGDGFAKEPAYWAEKQLWMRENYAEIRKKFVDTGCEAKTMAELGFEYKKRND
ncbi:Flavin-dependent monooxygenase [Hyphodiscus hymeniophilus]|uniref:Flavin-dependent monooxygenase n=1 Tax=Hyphodiscus hymeniophilus TaxID=353542 RepID=A0A9P7AUA4_9HELO|nr:Flavin-dependent monooxygenase [Hyphodiscus hymeniophilus]